MFFDTAQELSFGRAVVFCLDLSLVAFLFYHVFLLLSRTRAFQVLATVLLLLALNLVARQLELKTLAWIIDNASSYLVIGLIVLMQPELRRIAVSITQNEFFRWVRPVEALSIRTIANAARSMAQKRIGSSIVILRKVWPQNIIDHAVALNAEVSEELIETIFWKSSPLHDGAILIEGNKIVSAASYLPLSTSRKLKKTHGARHRSALGMAEDTDAIVIVSSEENGRISVCIDGSIISPKHSDLEGVIESFLNLKKSKA